ncbi:conjugal transfer protein TraG N-terminal domain-containing protein [Methylomonas sp. UP202]|uniref:conjugal transfer protein TraG N-terminal domain-containing protein n=1 Tax=Methylomonas sp. UP202 TaxID=3040943 RepID=UPI0024789584|nr:conjugal transfer protein TraG N-terminal domain-containing protein [Methylomonas sp. UP202]WGS83863.1 conjugal transfer protein TraG N-terminal domain-containing protein [Methylomonas sp. UP202]
MFEIFSVGDSAYLQAVLNAIAMISGTGDYRTAAAVGGLIGVIIVMLRALLQWDGRGIRYQDLLLAYVLWLMLYAPSVRVSVEDAYTGSVVVVDNVPLGPAVVGSVMSNMGYRTTRLFEQGFGTPSMTGNGFADSLQTLTAVRKNLLSRINLGAANVPNAGSDMETSFANYVRECTLTGVDLNQKSVDAILRDADPLNAIRFDSDIYMTEIYVGGQPQTKTCTDAWAELSGVANGNFATALESLLQPTLGVPAAADTVPKIQDAFDALAGPGVIDAADYMLMSAIMPMFEKGVIGRHEDGLHWNKAAMVEQAIQQRNTQWAAEQTLFAKIVRPMMAFIEGLSYAIAPIMAFVVMLGNVGIRMNIGYFSMLLWIQLWMPILAVINLFIQMSAAGKMAALTTATYNLPSMMGIYQLDIELQQWLSIGGMLAASTPAITLMLIYRGAVTATHFLGRMDGGDYVNEKIATPDVISPAPVLNAQAQHQYSPLSAVTQTGVDKVLPTFTAGKDMSAAVSSAYSASEQATNSFMHSVSSTASRSASISNDAFDSRSLGNQIASNSSYTDAYNRQFGEAFAKKHADTGISADQFSALVAGSANAGAKLGNDQLSGAISGRLQNDFKVSQDKSDAIAADISQTVNDSQGYQAGLAKSLAMDAQAGTRNVASMGLQNQSLSSLQHSATDAVSASESYQQTLSAQQRFGTQASFGAAETGNKIAHDPGLMERLDRTLDQYGLRGDTQRLASQWKAAGWISDADQAYAAAGMSLLTGFSSPNYRTLDDQQSHQAQISGYQLLGDVFNAPKADQTWNASRNESLKANAPETGKVQASIEQAHLDDPRAETESLNQRAQAKIRSATGKIAGGEALVESQHERNLAEREQQSSQGFGQLANVKAEHFRQSIAAAANETPSAAEATYDYLGGSIYNTAKNIEAMGSSGAESIKEFTSNTREAYSNGASFWESVKYGASKSYSGFIQTTQAWADQRINEIGDELTPSQKAYYRAAMFEAFAGISVGGGYSGNLAAAKQQLIKEEGYVDGNNISKLLLSAVGQNRMDLINQIGNFNRARGLIEY